jgi:hypothetical protein
MMMRMRRRRKRKRRTKRRRKKKKKKKKERRRRRKRKRRGVAGVPDGVDLQLAPDQQPQPATAFLANGPPQRRSRSVWPRENTQPRPKPLTPASASHGYVESMPDGPERVRTRRQGWTTQHQLPPHQLTLQAASPGQAGDHGQREAALVLAQVLAQALAQSLVQALAQSLVQALAQVLGKMVQALPLPHGNAGPLRV